MSSEAKRDPPTNEPSPLSLRLARASGLNAANDRVAVRRRHRLAATRGALPVRPARLAGRAAAERRARSVGTPEAGRAAGCATEEVGGAIGVLAAGRSFDRRGLAAVRLEALVADEPVGALVGVDGSARVALLAARLAGGRVEAVVADE